MSITPLPDPAGSARQSTPVVAPTGKISAFLTSMADRPLLAGLLCFAVILVFHSPRWWLMIREAPGTFEWDRALTYLRQCTAPLSENVEPAMRWRFVPQVFVWLLGGSRALALTIPWLGAWALLAFLHRLARRHGADALVALCMTITLGASAPLLVSTGWLGMNDAWVALGLCYLAFGETRALLALGCVLCPFIDERFVFGVPCAVVVRNLTASAPVQPRLAFTLRVIGQTVLAVAPFAAGRIGGLLLGRDVHGDANFLSSSVRGSTIYLGTAPLAAWMAFRFAWVPVAQAFATCFKAEPYRVGLLVLASAGPVLIGFLLASDTMRTTGIVLPLCVWAALGLARNVAPAYWRWLALANLLVPAAHVVYTKVGPINCLPLELWRLLH